MPSHNPFEHRFLAVLAAFGILVLPSCSSDEEIFATRYPVSGKVTYNDQPVARGMVNFTPDGKGVGASGAIKDGSYVLSTGGDKDGALPGKYKVTITAKEDVEAAAKAEFAKVSKKPEAEITRIPGEFIIRAENKAKSLVPLGYGDLRTTTLTAEVKEGTNTIPFTLSDTDAPPEPPKATKSAKGKGRK